MTLLEREPAQLAPQAPGYDVQITPELVDGEVVYMARHPDLPGCVSHGATPQEASDSLTEAREMYLEALESSGLPIPEPKPNPRTIIATLHHSEPVDATGIASTWTVRVPGGGEMQLHRRRTSTSG